jgi:hypothetical protein
VSSITSRRELGSCYEMVVMLLLKKVVFVDVCSAGRERSCSRVFFRSVSFIFFLIILFYFYSQYLTSFLLMNYVFIFGVVDRLWQQ